MEKQDVPLFDMIAVSKVDVGGVEYQPGEVFSVFGVERVRWLESQGVAKSASSVDSSPVVAGKHDAAADGITTGPTVAEEGTQHEQKSTATRRRASGSANRG